MAVLVCGGAGYIGSHCVYPLLEKNEDVIVVDNLQTGHLDAVHKDAKFYQGDIKNRGFLDKVFSENQIEAVIHFAANSRVHPLKIETLALMKEAGCYAIAFGFESGSEETLKRIHKGTTKEQARQACEWAKQVGLLVYGFFMIGFPWENDKHLQATKEFIFELDPDFLEIFIAYPYYGTRLYQLCLDDDLISQDVYGGDFFTTQQVRTKYLSNCELVRFRKKVLTKFYLRPRYLFRKFVRAATHPRIVFNYIKFGFRLIRNTVID